MTKWYGFTKHNKKVIHDPIVKKPFSSSWALPRSPTREGGFPRWGGVDFPDSGEDVGFADRWGASCKEVADEVRQKGVPAEG